MTTKKPAKPAKPTIKATLHILGRKHEAKGKTVSDVMNKLEIPVAKTMGILRLEKGDMSKERILKASVINGVFGQRSPTMKNIAMKSIISLFNDFDK